MRPEGGRASRADRAACAALIRGGSRSFHAASRLLPGEAREGAYALYAFCRLSDDAVDAGPAPGAALDRLRRRLDRVYAGQPEDHPVDRALADAVVRFAVPRACFDALIEGLAWDLAGRRYDTLSAVLAYGARVAGSVGAMMAALLGARDPARLARACDLGVAMQLTNIARDVGEDARIGRLYLPGDWLREDGLDPEGWRAAPRPHRAIAAATERLLRVADDLYARAAPGVAALPAAARPAIAAAAAIYRAIGAEVRANGCDPQAPRAVVAGRRKAALAAQACLWSLAPSRAGLAAPPLPETRFLVAALADAPVGAADASLLDRLDARVGSVFDLFHALEARDRAPQMR